MINLLPLDAKQNLRYARRNTILMKWAAGLFVGVLGIALVTAGGWMFLDHSEVSYTSIVSDSTDQLKAQKLDTIQAQADSISSNLKLVVQVLGREVLFSKLLQQIGAALPKGSVLTDLNIIQGASGLDLQADTVDYQTATQIQVNLQDPNNKIFSKADIVSIQCQSPSSAGAGSSFSAAYPCKADIRVQFAANNPFLFINNKASTKGTT